MPELTEADLKLKIKSAPVGAYLLCGDEDYLIKVYTDKLIKTCVDESFYDFNLHVFDKEGKDDKDLSEIYENAMAVPMMAESKCVLVKNYPVEDLDEGDLNALRELLTDNPEDNCLIFSYPSSQPKAKDLAPVVKLFSELGYVVKLNRKTASEISAILERGAVKRGKKFDKGVANYLINSVGNDLNLLNNELEKVCAYGGDVITKSDVDAVCIKSVETKVYDMINELTSGNFDKAFRLLSALFAQREDEYMILGAINSQYADIYRAKAARKADKTFGELIAGYPAYKGKEWRLDKMNRFAGSLSFEQLARIFEILADADTALKSTSRDKKQVLEQTLVLLSRTSGR